LTAYCVDGLVFLFGSPFELHSYRSRSLVTLGARPKTNANTRAPLH
jgi:hypothetical protein